MDLYEEYFPLILFSRIANQNSIFDDQMFSLTTKIQYASNNFLENVDSIDFNLTCKTLENSNNIDISLNVIDDLESPFTINEEESTILETDIAHNVSADEYFYILNEIKVNKRLIPEIDKLLALRNKQVIKTNKK